MTSYGPSMIIDRCRSAHRIAPDKIWSAVSPNSSLRVSDSENNVGLELDEDEEQQVTNGRRDSHHMLSLMTPLRHHQATVNPSEYGSVRRRTNTSAKKAPSSTARDSIRFQVVVWDVGPVDVALGRVPMTFRVSMFWDDVDEGEEKGVHESSVNDDYDTEKATQESHTEWQMRGRRKAYERLVKDDDILKTVDVPPLSLLNVVTFDVVGAPEICSLREQQRTKGTRKQRRRLMQWTCLYKATLLQQNMKLNNFPHDEHVLSLKLGILVHRRPGGRWDINKYRLDLATEDDSQHSTRIPHGLIVDHARIPDFTYNANEGLEFHFVPLSFGVGGTRTGEQQEDQCLEVRLKVKRDSGYYDNNIFPLLFLLNIVAVAIPMSLECTAFFQRGLMLLNITFVQIGIRMNVDRHLPSVGYKIKLQRLMNQFFFSLLLLVLESSVVYVLHEQCEWTFQATHHLDNMAAFLSFSHIVFTYVYYYSHCFPRLTKLFRQLFYSKTSGKL